MLSPTSLAGLSITPTPVHPVRQVAPLSGGAQALSQPAAPVVPIPLDPAAVQPSGPASGHRVLPRGSLLDLSV